MQYTYGNQQRIDEGVGSLIGRFLTKLFGKTGGKLATKGIGKLTLGKGAATVGLGAAGGYGIDKLTSNENQFDNRDVIAKLTSDIQAFGRAVDLNNDLSLEARSKVKEYMKDIEEMITQDLERHERYFNGNLNRNNEYNNINPTRNGFDYGFGGRYGDNMYLPGHYTSEHRR